ncbi:polar amino acid transport system permease protein [Clostridium collagenovorans DSM 3089]|uniref:Polar amino acid transport system permease protein n=1 Tax=Clostridium collagenovorans DSM 3089 TaxID=1121306 RepID=A0A1M5UAY4_9CLOT|nr:amino acid ABC transporter permease [Clostridium collagenovorans]SHH60006.1 polar amino acid transport system permease protein [Clostridium collagenovorans DSM 3089]
MFILATSINMDFSSMTKYMPMFMEGILMTLALSLATVILGTLIGFIMSLLKRSQFNIWGIKPLNILATIYTQVIRGTPMLLQVYLIVYGLPGIGVQLPKIAGWEDSRVFIGCVAALAINSGAYVCEIFRSGLAAIDKGQSEAGRSLGLSSKQTMRYIIVPQAIKVILPALGNELIMMIKESSIVSVVGLFDIMYTHNIVKGATLRTFEPLIIAGVIYLILTTILTTSLGLLERRLNTDVAK